MYSAEVLKATMQKSTSVPAGASPVLPARGTVQPSSTLLVKKSGAGGTLTPLGPLGFSLRDDDEASSSTSVRPRRQQQPAAADAGYTTDELDVLRSLFSCCYSHCRFTLLPLLVGQTLGM